MSIEPILSLAFSMHAEKGAYALLLGSGVSRAAKIPTGWEVTLDLIRKIAELRGEDCGPRPEEWYRDAYGEESSYSKILEVLGKTAADRRAILRAYFEPTEEERARREKLPTAAHHRIAQLVSMGYVRVVVTTNFDHLIEDALRAAGVNPVIISTADGALGAPPLSQSVPMVIKANGDYLDARIKNTEAELSTYEESLDKLLDRIFDEFGLIVCGWSAEWDTAMRSALQRCNTYRFTTYWSQKGSMPEVARRLVYSRRAVVLGIQDADSFFGELADKVLALEEMNRPHPLDAKVAVATLETYLADPQKEISTHKLITRSTETLYEALSEKRYPIRGSNPNTTQIKKRLESYEADTEVVAKLMVTGCYWGGDRWARLWTKTVERIANPTYTTLSGGYSGVWYALRKYPALLLLYAGGVAATAHDQYETVAQLLNSGTVHDLQGDEGLLIALIPPRILDSDFHDQAVREVFGRAGWHSISQHIFEVLHEAFRPLLPLDDDYNNYFDRFECILDLHFTTVAPKGWMQRWPDTIPLGRLISGKRAIAAKLSQDFVDAGVRWPLLKAGLFTGAPEALIDAMNVVQQIYARHGAL
jgi:hypothetical protein